MTKIETTIFRVLLVAILATDNYPIAAMNAGIAAMLWSISR